MRSAITVFLMFLSAQSVSATITGTIIDSSGNPIPRALVMFTSEPDSVYTYRAVTDSMGYYEITELPVGVADEEPAPFALGQNYPNPFNPATTIPLTLDAPGHVSLTVYNSMGQRIRTLVDGELSSGTHSVIWDARDESGQHVGSGVYLYAVRYNGYTEAKKMLLLDSGGMSGAVSAPVIAQTSARKVSNDPIYSISVERFPYTAIHQTYVSITSHTYDFTLEDAGLMVSIPGGTFQMGDEVGDLDEDCRPVHEVTLTDFEMDKYEVTNEQYCAYLNVALLSGEVIVSDDTFLVLAVGGEYDGRRLLQMIHSVGDHTQCGIEYHGNVFRVVPGYEDWPVVYIPWYGAKSFATSWGYDLPTEAEWEYAARGGQQYLYGTSDGTIDSTKANYNFYINNVTSVGSYPSNPYGLYDMTGNVGEWCHDWYGEYSSENATDPTGPMGTFEKVIRGGSWSNYLIYTCRTAYRLQQWIMSSTPSFGFRVVNRPQG